MPKTTHTARRVRASGLVLALTGAVGVITPAAEAAASAAPSGVRAFGARATSVAADYEGTRYLWGGTSPRGFDCSGFTQYVFARLGKNIPRVSQSQYDRARKVGKKVRTGDLVFFYTGSTRQIFHVGIYAGDGRIWHAPKPGGRVRLERLWTTRWTGGRY